MEKKKEEKEKKPNLVSLSFVYTQHKNVAQGRESMSESVQGWAPVAAGTCVARALGEEMTGEPAMLAIGWDEDMDVTPPTGKQTIVCQHL